MKRIRFQSDEMSRESVLGGWSVTMEIDCVAWQPRMLDYLLWIASKVQHKPMKDCLVLVDDGKESNAVGKPFASGYYGGGITIIPYCWLVEQPEYKAIHDDYMAEQAVKVLTR